MRKDWRFAGTEEKGGQDCCFEIHGGLRTANLTEGMKRGLPLTGRKQAF